MVFDQWQVDLIQQINTIFKKYERPLTTWFLIKSFRETFAFDRRRFFFVLNLMLKNEIVKKLKNGKLVLSYEWVPADRTKVLTGQVSLLASGSAFVRPPNQPSDEEEIKYFIHKSNVNGAIEGDVVEICLIHKSNQSEELKLPEAIITKIKSHTKTRFVGTFFHDRDSRLGYYVLPNSFQTFLEIRLDDANGLADGDKIYFEIYASFPEFVKARVIRWIGNTANLRVEIEALLLENDLALNFPQGVVEESDQIYDNYLQGKDSTKNWTRLDLTFITIDPQSAKDYDDAVYVAKNVDGSYRLVVAIAAVSAYVKTNSLLDKCAYKRGCSLYLADRVLPMLPPCLSDELCSLNESDAKKVFLADMTISQTGDIVNYKVYPGLIKNYRRCHYGEINDLIDSSFQPNTSGFDQTFVELIKHAYDLSQILSANHTRRGLVSFDLPEVKPQYDEKLDEIKIVVKNHGCAEKLVENFMIAANEAVTLFARDHKLPFIYRVHSGTNKELIPDFLKALKRIGVNDHQIDFDHVKPKELADWLEENKNHDNFNLLNRLVLRILGKAHYSAQNTHHFALASDYYTHFTSPIRRYADLIVHRIFAYYVFFADAYTDDERNQLKNKLESICETISELEIKAIDMERKVDTLLFCRYMEKHIGEKFNATIVSLQSFGMFVEMENLVEGFVHITQISEDDFFNYHEEGGFFIGKKTGRKYSVGNKIRVVVLGVDHRALRINLKIVSNEEHSKLKS